MMLALSELLCYAAIPVVLDRKYRRNARKSREWNKKLLLKRQDFSHVNLLKELRFHPKDWHNFLRMNESRAGLWYPSSRVQTRPKPSVF